MSDRFSKAFKVSMIVHGVLLAIILLAPFFGRCSKPKKKEQVMLVEMVAPTAPPAPAPAPPPKPEPPKPPEPKPPEPKPEPPPEPKPTLKKPDEIKRQTNQVVRRPEPAPQAPKPPPTLTPEQIAAQLTKKLPTTSTPAPVPGGTPSELGAYYARIQRILYEAWQQPPGVSGLSVQVSLRIQKSGIIIDRRITRRSGSAAMDDSVMSGLRSVTTLPALPESVRDSFHDVTITFETSGLSM